MNTYTTDVGVSRFIAEIANLTKNGWTIGIDASNQLCEIRCFKPGVGRMLSLMQAVAYAHEPFVLTNHALSDKLHSALGLSQYDYHRLLAAINKRGGFEQNLLNEIMIAIVS